ncbi:MAG: (d)CMP kinase, partial [Bacteroidales bacterium]|nr:(d)CMP kinase [Bacteroidales bacterium]
MNTPKIIIAIDGFSSTGKSSFAKLIAARLGFVYLDSGALYRGVTLFAIENGLIDENNNIDLDALAKGLQALKLHFASVEGKSCLFSGERNVEADIRTLAVSSKVSPISAVGFVRAYVDDILHECGKDRRLVMDGRD